MRLHMGDAMMAEGRTGLERADLVGHPGLDLPRALGNDATSKTAKILKSRMGADRHAASLGRRGGGDHDRGIAAMEAAGDVGRRDELEERRIVTERVGSVALAEIGVEIDLAAHAARAGRARNITPNPSSSSPMKRTPSPSRALRMASSVRLRGATWSLSIMLRVTMEREARAASVPCVHFSNPRPARI